MDYPDSPDLFEGKFTDGDPVAGIPASVASADQMNAVYDELINVITFAGVTPSPDTRDQLKQALDYYRAAENLTGTIPVARLPSIDANKLNGQPGSYYLDMANLTGQVPVARTYGASTMFEKNIVSNPAFQLDAGTLKNAADLTCVVNNVAYKYDEGAGLVLPGSMSIGTDYAIYATPDGLVVSANFTTPDGYTALTSRRVGGFHYQNGEINEFSLYDIKYCPNARNAMTKANDPRGMFRIPGFGWSDIYLLNTTPDLLGTSAYGATIADGSSPPKKPEFWGGDGTVQYSNFTQYIATEVLAAFGKRVPTQHEFAMLAAGTVAGYAVGTDPGTVQFDESTTSRFGAVGASGVIWQWGSEVWDRGNGSSGYAWYAGDTNGEGQIYTAGSAGVGASRFGGSWAESGVAGSRASTWYNGPWSSLSDIGARGVCDHFESC